MILNDPLGDMLTRIRNAQMRSKSTVNTPASKLRGWVLDVLAAEGYIRGYDAADNADGRPEFEISLKYLAEVFRRRSGDPRTEAGVEAGPARLRLGQTGAPGPQRPRRLDRLDLEGRHVGRSRSGRECRWRSALHRVLRREIACLVSENGQ